MYSFVDMIILYLFNKIFTFSLLNEKNARVMNFFDVNVHSVDSSQLLFSKMLEISIVAHDIMKCRKNLRLYKFKLLYVIKILTKA